ncbi:B-cell receptor CD22-like [Channa argus]|uniref:B-cell receptor CD22-like n=1 Tax=Channa argus TaxID=215402 RepID=UPI00352032B9
MRFHAAASGFVVVLLSVSVFLCVTVIQGQSDRRVTYTSTQICGIKRSTVEIHCTYTYPSRIKNKITTVNNTLWFTKGKNNAPVDLLTDSDYTGRVLYQCENNKCTLTITDLRLRDSAVYKFRFTTNQPGRKHTGLPGVTLSVTDLQMQVIRSEPRQDSTWAEVKCQSSCLPDNPTFIWYKNGQKTWRETTSPSHTSKVNTGDYSCAVKGHENFPSSTVLIQGHNDWRVTYTSTQICGIKGSTVEIRYTYTYPSRMNNIITSVNKTLWFTKGKNNSPVDLLTDSDYTGRVRYHCENNKCTLTITDLRLRDSAVYKFRFITNQPGGSYTGECGVTLSVTDLQMQVIRSERRQDSTWAEVKCQSSCLPDNPTFIWYKNGQKTWRETTSPSHEDNFNSTDSYSCAVKGHEKFPSPPVYAPQLPSVSVSPSAEIVEGSSVTLTCSSDANPAANYTWFKQKGQDPKIIHQQPQLVFGSIQSSDSGQYYCRAANMFGRRTSEYMSVNVKYSPKIPFVSVSDSADIIEGSSVILTCSSDANPIAQYTWYMKNGNLLGTEPQHVFSSIEASDSGEYYCTAANELGRRSEYISIDVKHAPQLPSVSVSPSAEIVEGSSVTLTCSSDANPAANYTWYKENGNPDLQLISKQQLVFSSIRSSDAGHYYCTAENKLGRRTSENLSINVQYAPKPPSVSVSPSDEIVKGSSVNLTCSSDANPAANYTWYKENEDSPKASGQNFTISDIRPEHSGNYYCEAQNTRGRQNSTLYLIVVAGKSEKTILALAFSLLIPLLVLTLFVSPTLVLIMRVLSISAFRSVTAAKRDATEEQVKLKSSNVRA